MTKEKWTKEHRRLSNLIRNGELPRWSFAKGPDGNLERVIRPLAGERSKLTWRQVDTIFSIIGHKPIGDAASGTEHASIGTI